MEEKNCEYTEKPNESGFRFMTTCIVKDKQFSFLASDRRLAVDLGDWVKQDKLTVNDFKVIEDEKTSDSNRLVIEIRKI